jgi:hypothetical protein
LIDLVSLLLISFSVGGGRLRPLKEGASKRRESAFSGSFRRRKPLIYSRF